MPRILVADDNSNIHRTVALALKEAGVEVIAVGNGEAAVRKIAEIKPDLVLADIFMPVRNGYEVCEFVKQDPRFSDIPVVLLIGAFDPFDEREAQRVRADAILKKPFVPPDSLLRTVADLLAQSASRLAPVPVAASVAHANRPAGSAAPTAAGAPEYMDAAPEEFAPAKARLEWDANAQPVAFGTLLETSSVETEPQTEADDAVITARRDPTLGEPAFWAPKPKPEGEQDGEETEPGEPAPAAGLVDEETWDSAAGPTAKAEEISEIPSMDPALELQDGLTELPEATAPVSEFASPAEPLQNLSGQLPELAGIELPSLENFEPLPVLGSVSPGPVPAVPALGDKSEIEKELIPDLQDFSWAAPSDPVDQVPAQTESVPETDSKSEEELIEAAAPALATLAPFLASLTSSASARAANPDQVLGFDPVPAVQSDLEDDSIELESADPLHAGPAVPELDRSVIEAIAQRVIDRMQPKIIELVTRELLRPAVEALVQRELEKK